MNRSSEREFRPKMISSPIPVMHDQPNNSVTLKNGHIKKDGIVYNKVILNANKRGKQEIEHENKSNDPITLKRKLGNH